MNKIKQPSPSERLIEIVKPYLEEKGFVYKKSTKDFIRKFSLGRQRFSLCFDGRGGLTSVDCGFFIYFDELNKLYEKIFETKTGDWSFQIGANLLRFEKIFERYIGFLYDDKFANMTLKEKSQYSSYEVHPQHKIQQGADFIIKAFDVYAETHFNKIDNYETLYDALIHIVRVRNKQIPSATPFLNLNISCIDEKLVYNTLILALSLGKETFEIEQYADDIFSRYKVGVDKIKQNIEKIYAYDKTEN